MQTILIYALFRSHSVLNNVAPQYISHIQFRVERFTYGLSSGTLRNCSPITVMCFFFLSGGEKYRDHLRYQLSQMVLLWTHRSPPVLFRSISPSCFCGRVSARFLPLFPFSINVIYFAQMSRLPLREERDTSEKFPDNLFRVTELIKHPGKE